MPPPPPALHPFFIEVAQGARSLRGEDISSCHSPGAKAVLWSHPQCQPSSATLNPQREAERSHACGLVRLLLRGFQAARVMTVAALRGLQDRVSQHQTLKTPPRPSAQTTQNMFRMLFVFSAIVFGL
ncbi:hypothetical protein KUCAC02_015820 [Chaenocephalus aceratus]|uniref:Uncharacterized protein n=1 Tax=Chaenocephalus aceratus TaxID=36190 RepID=A0ACB9Y143_CHAAC|nr:hypothetical protein KUCAC02_015820 [Chaenocephalus aceratus]